MVDDRRIMRKILPYRGAQPALLSEETLVEALSSVGSP
jgi:hypothetical protein